MLVGLVGWVGGRVELGWVELGWGIFLIDTHLASAPHPSQHLVLGSLAES